MLIKYDVHMYTMMWLFKYYIHITNSEKGILSYFHNLIWAEERNIFYYKYSVFYTALSNGKSTLKKMFDVNYDFFPYWLLHVASTCLVAAVSGF